jgi:hypothetical protein
MVKIAYLPGKGILPLINGRHSLQITDRTLPDTCQIERHRTLSQATSWLPSSASSLFQLSEAVSEHAGRIAVVPVALTGLNRTFQLG